MDESIVGAWRGIHAEKNTSGPIAVVAIFIHFFLFTDTRRVRHLAVVALAAFFLWKTQSKTSISLAPVALMIGIYFRFGYRNTQMALFSKVAISLATIVVLSFLYIDFDAVYDLLFGDPTSFTGRTEIWNVMLDYLKQHPFLGSGYGSFWNIGPDGPSSTHGGWVSDFVAVGHNGYLDILAQTGAIGFALTLVACIVMPIRHMLSRYDAEWRSNNAAWLSVVVFASLHNFQESSFMERDNPLWVTLLFAIFLSRSAPDGAVIAKPALPRDEFPFRDSPALAHARPVQVNRFRNRPRSIKSGM
jgi:O-antigen ligase